MTEPNRYSAAGDGLEREWVDSVCARERSLFSQAFDLRNSYSVIVDTVDDFSYEEYLLIPVVRRDNPEEKGWKLVWKRESVEEEEYVVRQVFWGQSCETKALIAEELNRFLSMILESNAFTDEEWEDNMMVSVYGERY